jgi:hypothetical protein
MQQLFLCVGVYNKELRGSSNINEYGDKFHLNVDFFFFFLELIVMK